MKPHERRVFDEKRELDERRMRLAAFISGPLFPTLPYAEQSRLKLQISLMGSYSDVLRQRIVAFPQSGEATT